MLEYVCEICVYEFVISMFVFVVRFWFVLCLSYVFACVCVVFSFCVMCV